MIKQGSSASVGSHATDARSPALSAGRRATRRNPSWRNDVQSEVSVHTTRVSEGTFAAAARAIAPVSIARPRRTIVPHANSTFASHRASRSRKASSP